MESGRLDSGTGETSVFTRMTSTSALYIRSTAGMSMVPGSFSYRIDIGMERTPEDDEQMVERPFISRVHSPESRRCRCQNYPKARVGLRITFLYSYLHS